MSCTRCPTLAAPSESAATLSTGTSTGPPAESASDSAREPRGSTPMTRTSPANQEAMPDISPPPPTATRNRVELRRLPRPFEPHRPLAGDGLLRVISVNIDCAGRGLEVAGQGQGIRVAVAAHMQFRAIGADAGDLHQIGYRGHEDIRPMAERARGIRDRGTMVSARRGDHARFPHGPGQEIVERTPRFEGARVLQQFQLETQIVVRAGGRTRQRQNRRPPDVIGYSFIGGRDGLSIGHGPFTGSSQKGAQGVEYQQQAQKAQDQPKKQA